MPFCRPLTRFALLSCFIFAAANGQTGLSVVPSELSLSVPPGANATTSATLAVSGRGLNVPFTASVRYLDQATGWLSVTPASGTTPANLTVSVNASHLPIGTYLGQVTVSGGGVGVAVNVFLAVGSGGGTLVVEPSGLTFLGQGGAAILDAQTISVANAKGVTGGVPFRAFASSDGNWLSVSPFPMTTPASVTVSAVQAGLRTGVYTGTVTLVPLSGGTPTVIPVALAAFSVGGVVDEFRLSQSSLTFTHQTGTAVPPVQVVRVDSSIGSGAFNATTTSSWLRLSSPFSPTPSTSIHDFIPVDISVSVEPGGLVPGTYVDTIVFEAANLPPRELPVTLHIVASPALNVQPSSASFESTGASQVQVTVTATGGANLAFTASATSSGSWLSVSPTTGSTASGAQVLTISVNRNGLPLGVHTGVVTLTVPATGAVTRIPVRLNITSASSMVLLEAYPETIDLTAIVGQGSPSQTLTITTPDVFTATATSTGGWLTVDPFIGNSPAALTVRANPAALQGPGTHNGSITLTSLATGFQKLVPVTFNLAEQAIVAEPSSLTFTQNRRADVPAQQTIEVRANTASEFTVVDVPAWLRVDPRRAFTPQRLNVWVEMSMMPPGSNNATIRIVGPRNEVSIPVVFQAAPPSRPTATPESLDFTYIVGDPAALERSIAIGATDEPVSFTVAASTESGVKWLSASPATGRTPANVLASINTSLLVPGRHTGAITVAVADGSAQAVTIPVSVTVSDAAITLNSVLHGATLVPTVLSPGMIVAITGAGLGPGTGISARPSAAGAYETRLADTRVMFDGVAAPVLFVRHDQVNAVVPYGVHGRVSSRVQVVNGTSYSLPVDTRVVDAAPGIFTLGPQGRGQAAALNVDSSANSVTNPAARGSVITVFGTGEGQTDPPGQDGRVISTDLRRPLLPATARIGGRPAEVVYVGSASMMVSGMFQMNIRIPEDIQPGVATLEVQVGSASAQPGITIAVR